MLNQLYFTVHTIIERTDYEEAMKFDTSIPGKKPVVLENRVHA
jgi:hypothetical protein